MFTFKDKVNQELFQWDCNITLKFNTGQPGDEVHFSNDKKRALVRKLDENLEVEIPNVLLQERKDIAIFLYTYNKNNYTIKRKVVSVIPRPKPDNYIYKEDEILTWQELDSKIRELAQEKTNEEQVLKLIKDKLFWDNVTSKPFNTVDTINFKVTEGVLEIQEVPLAKVKGLIQALKEKISSIYVNNKKMTMRDGRIDISVPTLVSQLDNDSKYLTEETMPKGPDWSNQPEKPTYIYTEVGAEKAGIAKELVEEHNQSALAHNDIRILIKNLTNHINGILDSEDVNLDQLSEIVAYIKNNQTLIEQVTTNKVNVKDIINNLTSNITSKPLSAAMGLELKNLLDQLKEQVNNIKIPTKLQELSDDNNHLLVTSTEKQTWNNKLSKETLQPAINVALTQAKESGEFNGPQGTPGKDGLDGVDGKDGYTPVKGVDYFDGKDGKDGKDGQPGLQGERGLRGLQGEKGADGAKGEDGLSAYQIALQNGFSGSQAEWLLSLKGEQGPQGEKGLNGIPGKNGKDGINGKDGLPGAKGEKGDKGEQGLPGIPGKDGTDGKPGEKGQQGEPGKDGKDGMNGSMGKSITWGLLSDLTVVSDTHAVITNIIKNRTRIAASVKNAASFRKGDLALLPGQYNDAPRQHYWMLFEVDKVAGSQLQGYPLNVVEEGLPGKTPMKGTDYWTTSDKQDIVNDVLAALPKAKGVDF